MDLVLANMLADRMDLCWRIEMKKRTASIGALVSWLPMGQSLVIGTGAFLTSAGLMLSFSGKAQAESADFYFNRATDKQEEGDYDGAISDYIKGLEINPKYSDAYFNRGLSN